MWFKFDNGNCAKFQGKHVLSIITENGYFIELLNCVWPNGKDKIFDAMSYLVIKLSNKTIVTNGQNERPQVNIVNIMLYNADCR